MDVGSKNIFQSQTRQGSNIRFKKCENLESHILSREDNRKYTCLVWADTGTNDGKGNI